MKLSAYRESLLNLTDQVLADYELQVLLQPADTHSPYFGKDLKAFAERAFNAVNSPQILIASSMGGTPVPGLTDLDSLPGTNYFNGDRTAPSLKAPRAADRAADHVAPTPPTAAAADFRLPSGQETRTLSREQLLSLLKGALGGASSQTRVSP